MGGESEFIGFLCDHCHTEIEASPDLVGQETECPACGMKLVIPDAQRTSDGIERHGTGGISDSALKSRTIRIELGDDL